MNTQAIHQMPTMSLAHALSLSPEDWVVLGKGDVHLTPEEDQLITDRWLWLRGVDADSAEAGHIRQEVEGDAELWCALGGSAGSFVSWLLDMEAEWSCFFAAFKSIDESAPGADNQLRAILEAMLDRVAQSNEKWPVGLMGGN